MGAKNKQSVAILSQSLASFEPKSGAPKLAQTLPDYPLTLLGWFHPPPCGSKGVQSKLLQSKAIFFSFFLTNPWFLTVPISFWTTFLPPGMVLEVSELVKKKRFDFGLK